MAQLPVYPFDASRCIGTVIEINGMSVRLNLPQAATPGSRWHYGHRMDAGKVGEFVVIESADVAVFGRIVAVRLPERERLSVEEELGEKSEAHPIGVVQMMATASLVNGKIDAGVPHHPRLGARCFSAHPELIKWLAEHTKHIDSTTSPKLINLATLPFSPETNIRISPESMFGRHCAILGATGGGKSWTLARIVQETSAFKSKIILIDATGEFHTLEGPQYSHVHIGDDEEAATRGSIQAAFPYRYLTEDDLFALFRPSGQSQAPKLRAAIKSLKLYSLEKTLFGAYRVLKKAGQDRKPIEDALVKHAKELAKPEAKFYISDLPNQIEEECIWPTDKQDAQKFGSKSDQDIGYCNNLIARIGHFIHSQEMACIFQPGTMADLIKDAITPFLNDPEKTVLRISLKELAFAHGIREIFVNALGRYLLGLGRKGTFKASPLLVVLDEAHQFVGKTVGEDLSSVRLDAFDLIAKEGRKYALTLCIATQRPRDLGQGILSQMGTHLVHRLTNPDDREHVEKAAGDLDRSAASFIPTLAAGQAVLIGIDFPIPVTLQISEPIQKPSSHGPKYQEHWSHVALEPEEVAT